MKSSVNTQDTPLLTMIWFAGLSMLGFLATDMYLPAFESIRGQMNTSESLIGMSLTIFLLGMAIGQIVYGPLSDRFGRIKILVAGMGLFTAGSVLCAFSTQIEVFLLARFIQALGACSATVIWQAVVIDRYDSQTSQRVFATIMPLVALSPAAAPLLGAGTEMILGWKGIFAVLAFTGLALIFFSLKQEESAPSVQQEEQFIQRLFNDYKRIFQSKSFIGYMLIFAGCSAAFFAWLTGTPFVMAGMGYSPADIGWSFIPQTIAFIIGGYACRALLEKMSGTQLLPFIIALFSVSIISIFFLSVQFNLTSIIPVIVPFCFLAIANGAVYPIVVNKALENFKECSATAAGLLNFLQTMICFLASAMVSAFASQGLVSVSSVMMLSALTVLGGLFLVRSVPQSLEQTQKA